jgi:hypothetical protein
MLEPLFHALGLSSNESQTYLALAALGKASASLLAKKQQVPRSTMYTLLDALLKRGVIAVEHTAETSYYTIREPDALMRMVEEERRRDELRYTARMQAAQELVPLLGSYLKRENYSVPKLQFFEGTAHVRSMLYQYAPLWQQSIATQDYTWWGYQDTHFVDTYPEWLQSYWASMHSNEKIHLLSNRSDTERRLKNRVSRRTIKVLPKQFQFSSTIWVLGEYVVTIMTRQEPHYAFQLQDAVFAANQRLTFQLLWSLID